MSRDGNGITATTFEWFNGLESNNDKEWFDANRDTYHSHVRDPFARFLEALSDRLTGSDLPVKGSAKTMFRINRDLRFTDDPRPYSESVSGMLTPGGTKNESGPLLYLELNGDGGRMGGGMYQAKAAALKPVRKQIIAEPDTFAAVLNELSEADISIDRTDQVETMPLGFADYDEHRFADIIRCKQLLAMRSLPKSAWLDDSAIDRCAEAAAALATLYAFIDNAS